jgi:hypothetical protein
MLAPFRFIYSSSVVTVQPLRHQVTKKRYEFQNDIKKQEFIQKNIQMTLFLFVSNKDSFNGFGGFYLGESVLFRDGID